MRSRAIPGHVKDRDALMRDANIVVDDSTITSHVKRIRRKFLALDPAFDRIATVYGMGYRWDADQAMKLPRIALSIRAQLLLVLTVFLALPWLGVEYVRELERVLRDAQERTLAGTAQAVATALHDRPRLFATPPDPIASFARERADERIRGRRRRCRRPRRRKSRRSSRASRARRRASGSSTATASCWRAPARSSTRRRRRRRRRPGRASGARRSAGSTRSCWSSPSEDFSDDAATQGAPHGRDVEGALAGILTTDRRPTSDGSAVIVSARAPDVGRRPGARRGGRRGDGQRGAGRAQPRVRAAVQHRAGGAAGRLARADRLRDVAVVAHPPPARRRRARDRRAGTRACAARELRCAATRSATCRAASASVLARLSEYASYQEKMASRLSHELRTPIAVVRIVARQPEAPRRCPPMRACTWSARRRGSTRLTQILTRMTEAARLEQSLSDVERERFDLVRGRRRLRRGLSRSRIPQPPSRFARHRAARSSSTARRISSRRCSTSSSPTPSSSRTGGAIVVGPCAARATSARLTVSNDGPPLPDGMAARLFESMVSVRPRWRCRRAAPGARSLHRARDRAVPRWQRAGRQSRGGRRRGVRGRAAGRVRRASSTGRHGASSPAPPADWALTACRPSLAPGSCASRSR